MEHKAQQTAAIQQLHYTATSYGELDTALLLLCKNSFLCDMAAQMNYSLQPCHLHMKLVTPEVNQRCLCDKLEFGRIKNNSLCPDVPKAASLASLFDPQFR